jgi:polyhydroxybutyrate depolymerase
MKPISEKLIFIFFILILQCNNLQKKSSSISESMEKNILIDGINRTYLLHIPKKKLLADEKIPMIVMLHGRFGTGKRMLENYRMNQIADRENFMVLYADGFQKSWADGRGAGPADKNKIDDVKFLETIIIQTSETYPVDKSRVFIAGHSNGGFMTQRMLIEKTNLFKAGASVTAHTSKNIIKSLSPKKSISVAIISGTEDPLVPYYGGYILDGEEVLGAEDLVRKWVNWNSCNIKPELKSIDNKSDETKLEIYSYSDCADKTNVKLYKIIGAGHNWPGVSQMIPFIDLGKETEELDASEAIWEFFKSQS